MSKIVIILLFFIGHFFNIYANEDPCLGSSKEFPLVKIENNFEEDITYILSLHINCQGKILEFITRVFEKTHLIPGRLKKYPIGDVKEGILIEKLGFKALKYSVYNFDQYDGGEFEIKYAYDLFKSRISEKGYRSTTVTISKVNGRWVLYSDSLQESNYIYIKVEKNFIGIPSGINDPEFSLLEEERSQMFYSFL